jgi:hypothetical protein
MFDFKFGFDFGEEMEIVAKASILELEGKLCFDCLLQPT